MEGRDAGRGPSGPKERTWRLMREAARELLRTGGPLTVAAAAELAGVSRATAYRYFPTNDAVVLHATMSLADDPLEDTDWAKPGAAPPREVGARAADLVRATAAWAFEHETELRTMLHLSLQPGTKHAMLRRGLTNRGRWIAALLEGLPSDVPRDDRDRLASALVSLFGSDAIVWTTDMAGLPREQAIDLLAWMAQVLVKATLAGW
ncbi:MAG: TetR/AcrR family transcriptional regulator [Actinomycetota bacterium]|nr:TetR/AcrR family transcriptional regulator [Actinomycetota bacterium]